MSSGKKRILFLCVALLIGGGWISMAAQSQDQKAQPAAEPNRSFLTDPNFAEAQDISLGNKGLFTRMMFCILLVAAMGYGVMYFSKRVLPKVTHSAGREIRVRETTYLGPRKALHIVEVGGRKLLIGSTSEHISTLADVTDVWLEASKQEPNEAVKL